MVKIPTHNISHWTWKNLIGDCIEPSLLWTSVHGTGKYSKCYYRRKVNIKPASSPSISKDDLTTWGYDSDTKHAEMTNQDLICLRPTLWDETYTQHSKILNHELWR